MSTSEALDVWRSFFGEDTPEYFTEDFGFGVVGRKQIVGDKQGRDGKELVLRDSANPTAL